MSPLVEVFVRDADGEWHLLDMPEGTYRSGGFESWRTTVRGSQAARALGARLLPQLAVDDLYVEAPDVPALLAEVELLRTHAAELARATARACTPEQQRRGIGQRLRIIEESCRTALEIGGGVLIW
ncbi:hypothetical protein ACN2WE_28860 [Streptomyces sp. cg28]|uniref:hypothetical protein n=1 Tax=Streptomyces sp. cg28 TaxID=3403457 RepID=UPI003B21D503